MNYQPLCYLYELVGVLVAVNRSMGISRIYDRDDGKLQ